jgi:hypothetical protein
MWELSIYYSLNVAMETYFKLDEVAMILTGRRSCSSGGGFGCRDLQFQFLSKADAEKAQERLLQDGRFSIRGIYKVARQKT